jgi:chemotaxis protein methyltransferase CheR
VLKPPGAIPGVLKPPVAIPGVLKPPLAVPGVSAGPKMTEETFRLFREFIYQNTGIYFQDNKKYLLEGRLAKRLQVLPCPTFERYLQIVKSGPQRAEELRFFYEAITINETYFFRNEPQFEAFEKTLVPSIVAQRGSSKGKIRVWSAASSSGEEAYTLAMLFLENLRPKYPGLEFEVVGTDISAAVLETARKGIYREYSVRNMPPHFLQKYIISDNGRFTVKDEVKRLVRFDNLNLYDRPRMRQMISFDIIFCCNVLIYFDTPSKVQVVSTLYDVLNRGGYLFIGYAESLHGISSAFKLINFPKTVAYKKE